MKGIIILAHGSRRNESDIILESLTRKVIEKTGVMLICLAFLQFSEQNLEKAVEELILKGAKQIVIVPMFIFDGVHVTQDIPNEVNELAEKHPGISITLTKHLGDDDRIADIIADRIII